MFRFSIRDVLMGILVIGMGLGWWCDRRQLNEKAEKSAERTEFLEWRQQEIFTMGGVVSKQTWDKVFEAEAIQKKRFAGQQPPKSEAKKR